MSRPSAMRDDLSTPTPRTPAGSARGPEGSPLSWRGPPSTRGGSSSGCVSMSVQDFHRSNASDKYSRLIRDEYARNDTISGNLWQSLNRSLSSPSNSQYTTPPVPPLTLEEQTKLGLHWKPPTFVDRPGINSRFNPHPVHLRGKKQLSKSSILNRGLDPLRDHAHTDINFDADHCRHERNAKIEGSKTRTPRHSDHWRTQDAWADRGVYEKPWKISHAWPQRTGNGGVGISVPPRNCRPPGTEIEERRQRGDGPFWPPPAMHKSTKA